MIKGFKPGRETGEDIRSGKGCFNDLTRREKKSLFKYLQDEYRKIAKKKSE
jgi:hypothetical protein